MSHQESYNCQQKSDLSYQLVIQRLVVELGEDYNALEREDDLGYIPEVLVGLSDGHSGLSVSVRPCP